jgi:hypothetical protein
MLSLSKHKKKRVLGKGSFMFYGATIKKIIFIGVLLLLSIVPVYAAPTPADTLIRAATFNLQYSDGIGYSISRDVSLAVDVTVDPVFGIGITPQTTSTVSIGLNETAYFPQVLGNLGNATDNISFTLDELTTSWSSTVYLDDNNNGIHEPAETTVVSSPLQLDGSATRSIFIALTAPNSYITPGKVIFHPQTTASPSGIYTGFNGQIYGGPAGTRVTENAVLLGAVVSQSIEITALFQGYFNTMTQFQRPITVNVQFRTIVTVNAGVSLDIPLDASGNSGLVTLSIAAGDHYLVLRQKLAGSLLGVNHVAFVSSESITLTGGQVATLNFSDPASAYYVPPFLPRSGYTPIYVENGYHLIKGGDATGERLINITDIVRWNNAATNPQADQRGDPQWSEDPNFDGDPYMNTDDFSVWNKNKGQNVPLPEED